MIALEIIGGFSAVLLYLFALGHLALALSGPDANPNIYFPTVMMGLVVPLAIAIQLGNS